MKNSRKWLGMFVIALAAGCNGSGSGGGDTPSYALGGSVTGLLGTGLVLTDGQGHDLAVLASGPFTFPTRLKGGSTYAVTVKAQPSSPTQSCVVANGSGTIAADVTGIAVACTTSTFTIGGSISNLKGSLVLTNNGGDDLTLSAGATSFTFATAVASGGAYAVVVRTNPTSPVSQKCEVTGGAGTVAAANVTSVSVTCTTDTYQVAGTVGGLTGSGLVLHLDPGSGAGEDLGVTASGPFSFTTRVASGAVYGVTVKTQPSSPAQVCSVAPASGVVGASDVSLVVTCASTGFRVRGTVSGLLGSGLVLLNNGSDDLPIGGNGSFAFGTLVATGAQYAVTVKTHPSSPTQSCTVANGSGLMGNADVTNVTVTCATASFTVGGTISNLKGGLVLTNNGGDDLAVVAGATSFTFATAVPSGGGYSVAVRTNPTSPVSQKCVVTNGAGTVTTANIVNVSVTCTTDTYTVGGTVTNLQGTLVLTNNGAGNLTLSAGATSFVFAAPVESGQPYIVAVLTSPASPVSQKCLVSNGSGTVTTTNVTNVSITCTSDTYALGGTTTNLVGSGLTLATAGEPDLVVPRGASTFTFANPLTSGTAYSVSVVQQPTSPSQTCAVTPATASGTVGTADVTSVVVTCSAPPAVVQKWVKPTTWGGGAGSEFWPSSDPALVQHAVANGATMVETKVLGVGGWTAPAGAILQNPFTGFGSPLPSPARYGAGPFTTSGGAPLRYQLNDGNALNLTGDMLVCAVIKPDWDPITDGYERVIIAKGMQEDSGWVLMQMHSDWCFHYQGVGLGGTHWTMAYTSTWFDAHGIRDNGPLNTSFTVVCGGRNGSEIVVAANGTSAYSTIATVPWDASEWMQPTPYPATIGSYDSRVVNFDRFVFNGQVFETAVWNLPATQGNIQAKFNAVLGGMALADGSIARYQRNREAPYVGADDNYHTTWRDGPRFDSTSGLLFGLQGDNRVAYPEDLSKWTPSGPGASAARGSVMPPGDSRTPATLVSLEATKGLSLQLSDFAQAGSVHGQVWLYVEPGATGTLRVRSDLTATPAGGPTAVTPKGSFDIDLAGLSAGLVAPQWKRVFSDGGITTDGPLPVGTVGYQTAYLENVSSPATTVNIHVWGLALTQVASAKPLGFDPGPTMYNTLIQGSSQELLELPPVPESTLASGFCLAVDATPPLGMPWNGMSDVRRSAISWRNASDTVSAQIYVTGPDVCFRATSGGTYREGCTRPSWATNSQHNLKGCVSAAGQVRLYLDNTQVSSVAFTPFPDLFGDKVSVGRGESGAWQGYISKAVVCRDTGTPTDCQ